ncbi:MAG TPA: OmpA family protein [Chitinophagales bacterium]|nr:OmpA family protein [Chitinophagales bacterium]
MKSKSFALLVLSFSTLFMQAQDGMGERLKTQTKDKVMNKTEEVVNSTIDKSIQKAEEGIEAVFTKKKKKKADVETASVPANSPKNTSTNTSDAPAYDPAVTQTDDKGNTDYSAYKNFDFVAGEKIIFFEDFADNSTKRWGAYDPEQLSIITHDNKKWMEVKSGNVYPIGLKVLPKNFTLEFDVYTPDVNTGTLDVRFLDKSQAESLADPWLDNCSAVHLSPITQMPKTGLGGYVKKINNEEVQPQNEFKFYSWQPELGNHYARVSMVRTDNKLSLWVNKEKVMEDVDFFVQNREHLLAFHLQNYFVDENRMYLTNIRLATGNANPKNDLTTQNKFMTQSIYFDVNSDVIRPNSYAILKQIAESIKATQGVIQIVGHTDSDGKDTDNLILSQKRSESVKRALVNEFGIDAARLTTEGKGESVPLNKNLTPADKAQNRRVEFIKL